jgi:hypothetical protein
MIKSSSWLYRIFNKPTSKSYSHPKSSPIESGTSLGVKLQGRKASVHRTVTKGSLPSSWTCWLAASWSASPWPPSPLHPRRQIRQNYSAASNETTNRRERGRGSTFEVEFVLLLPLGEVVLLRHLPSPPAAEEETEEETLAENSAHRLLSSCLDLGRFASNGPQWIIGL